MNEKIKELYIQANRYASLNGLMKYDKADNINWVWEDTVAEKFAELIVKECAEIARVFSVEGVEYDGGDAIREHFGVEP